MLQEIECCPEGLLPNSTLVRQKLIGESIRPAFFIDYLMVSALLTGHEVLQTCQTRSRLVRGCFRDGASWLYSLLYLQVSTRDDLGILS